MSKTFDPAYQKQKSISWREYQGQLKKRKKPMVVLKYGVYLGIVFLIFYSLTNQQNASSPPAADDKPPSLISKKSVPVILSNTTLNNFDSKQFQIKFGHNQLTVTTTLKPELQKELLTHLDKRNSVFISIVALNPLSGKVLAMVSHDRNEPDRNICLSNEFPAASIFKIVTAAAAIEEKGYASNSIMHFNGFKHTLYKNQLEEVTHRKTNHISFRDSFAQSVNPVFGKLGSLYLKKDILQEYSERFGFNEGFSFEIPLPPSRFSIRDNSYNWAEIASGFNRQTTLSAIHAAMLVSVILNKGEMIEPSIIERIEDSKGGIYYASERIITRRVISEKTSRLIREMMTSVVQSGTARKSFLHSRRDKTLSLLFIGGKTGSISSQDRTAKFDWFVGFAEDKKGMEKIVVAALVGHGDYIGRRASEYAKLVFKTHFQDYFKYAEKNPVNTEKKDRS